MNIKGMTTEQLLKLDIDTFDRLSRSELSRVVSAIGATANKRLKRIQSKGIKTPAERALISSGGKISAKGKTEQQLRLEYVRARQFLRKKTSTLTGAKKFKEEIRDTLHQKGIYISDAILNRAVDLVQQYRDQMDTTSAGSPPTIEDMIHEIIAGGTDTQIIERLKKRNENEYLRKQADRADFDEYFEWEDDT